MEQQESERADREREEREQQRRADREREEREQQRRADREREQLREVEKRRRYAIFNIFTNSKLQTDIISDN